MKTKITLRILIMSALLSSMTFSYGQCGSSGSSCHNNSTSRSINKYAFNGGQVKQVDKYIIEMVYDPFVIKDPINFYLMNKKGKPISDQGIEVKAKLTYQDGIIETIILERRGENRFAGKLQKRNQSFVCILTLGINSKTTTVQFDGTSALQNSGERSTYTCPMHPEVKSGQAGNCSKCGMSLEKLSKK